MRSSEPRPAPMRNFCVVSSSSVQPRALSGAVADLESRSLDLHDGPWAIERHSPSLSDALYGGFPFFVCTFQLLELDRQEEELNQLIRAMQRKTERGAVK